MKHKSEKSPADHPVELQILAEVSAFELGLAGSESLFESPSSNSELLLPGCADLQVASIQRIGYRGEFPRPGEWEHLLALLEPEQELFWIITKRPQSGFSFHLALKSNLQPHAAPSRTAELRSHFRSMLGLFTKRSFPESLAEECNEEEIVSIIESLRRSSNGEVVVTSGFPSPSVLEDSREFPEPSENQELDVSLNDMVEPFADEAAFSIVFTVGRASAEDANQQLCRMAELRTAISPFLKIQTSDNQSQSTAKQEGTQRGKTASDSQTEGRNILSAFFQKIVGSRADEVRGSYIQHQHDPDASRARNFLSWATKNPIRVLGQKALFKSAVSRNVSTSEMTSESVTETAQLGTSTSLTSNDAMLELVDQKLQEGIRSLKKAAGTGAFFFGAEVFSPKPELSLRIARNIAGTLAGARTHIRPFQTVVYRGPGALDHLSKLGTLDEYYPAITIQSRHIAAHFLPVPEADLPGLKTKRNVFYGKPNPSVQSPEDEAQSDTIWLGDLAHLSTGFRSRPLPGLSAIGSDSEFRIPATDLTSHLLIAGTTGSGKTQRAASLLNSLSTQRFQVVVIESAKKTYRKLLRRQGVANRILAFGESGPDALRINPFYFEPGAKLKRHISIFSDALADLLPVEALIGPKLREAIQRCYQRYEWDIESGTHQGEGVPVYPNMADLHMEVMAVAASLKHGPELNSNYKGALIGRTKLFIDELYQDIFGWGGSLSLDELFGEDDIIFEMDELPPSEAKMPSFVLSLLLERMRSWQQKRQQNQQQNRDLVIVIEEAHNLLEKSFETQRSEREMGSGGFLLKQIVRLLQEGREAGMAIVVIDQSPASLADAVIRNTNTKIILRITDSEEAEKIGSSLGLTKEECRDLHDLEDGEAVVKVKNAGKALKLCPGRMVEKSQGFRKSVRPTLRPPEYFKAAGCIREIEEICREPELADMDRLIHQVALLLQSGSGHDEAVRFFAQKLIGAAMESGDKTFPIKLPPCPKPHDVFFALSGIFRFPEVDQLGKQVYSLLSRLPWDQAKSESCRVSDVVLQMLSGFLSSQESWALMGGGDQFVSHLAAVFQSDSATEEALPNYEQAMILAHSSPERFMALKRLLLQIHQ